MPGPEEKQSGMSARLVPEAPDRNQPGEVLYGISMVHLSRFSIPLCGG